MGSWDCYCAICGSTLTGAHIASKPRSARFRNSNPHNEQTAENENEDENESENEEYTYDPAVVSEADVEWTQKVYVLGFNPDATGIKKAFVAGPGSYSDYGSVDVDEQDPNWPDDGFFNCYYRFDGNQPVFPFHWCCYELLVKAVTDISDSTEILDQDTLYNTMEELSPEYGSSLTIDYGDPGPPLEQFFSSNAGEEFLVAQPTPSAAITSLLRNAIAQRTFQKQPPAEPVQGAPPALEARVVHDPFVAVPYDILYKVFRLLPFQSLTSLSNASYPIHAALCDNPGFWKQLLRNSMPWFFELHELLEDVELTRDCDFRALFFWLEHATRPRLWLHGPFMCVANRRRIWAACEQLAERYRARIDSSRMHDAEPPDELAMHIMQHADNPQMPLVAHSTTGEGPTVASLTAQWVRSWKDLDVAMAVVDAFWDAHEGSLVGLVSGFGQSRDLLGRDDGPRYGGGARRESVTVARPGEIRGLVLHLKGMEIEQPGAETWVQGVTIVHANGDIHLGVTDDRSCSHRPLLLDKGKHLVGLVGQAAAGRISRLGLLQAARPPLDDFEVPSPPRHLRPPPEQQRHLWKSDLRNRLHHNNNTTPLWAHPTLRVIIPASGFHHGTPPDDVLPYEPLLWARDARDLRRVARLSAHVIVGGTITMLGPRRVWDYHVLCGSRVRYDDNDDEEDDDDEGRCVGKVAEDDDDGCMAHFDIDGRGGEVVTRVEVAMDGMARALKLRTNRGRETLWAEQPNTARRWETLEAPDGETIVGLALKFGAVGGAKEAPYAKMSAVGILTMPLA